MSLAAVSNISFGLAMLVVAAVVLGAGISRRCNRWFAAVLALRGTITVANQLADLAASPRAFAGWEGLAEFSIVLFPFALAGFTYVYLRPTWSALTPPATLVAGLALAAVPLAWPCARSCGDTVGWMTLLGAGLPLAEGAAAILIAVAAGAATKAPRAEVHWLLAHAFMAMAVVDGLLPTALLYAEGTSISDLAGFSALYAATFTLMPVGAILGTVAAAWLVRISGPSCAFPDRRKAPAGLWTIAASVSIVTMTRPAYLDAAETGQFLTGLVRLAMPSLAAYALIRYRFPVTPRAVRRGINGTLVVGLFISVYFILSEGAAAIIADRTGNTFVGILGAGFLVLMITPLERSVRQFTGDLSPPAPSKEQPVKARLRFYREQMDLVWMDGIMGVKERIMMDHLRRQLDISASEADRIESQVVARISTG